MKVYKTHNEIPTSITDFVLNVSGESDIKKVTLKDINGIVELMEGVNTNGQRPEGKTND